VPHGSRSLKSDDVLACLTELFTIHGPPDHIRSDNGAEFTANAVREWLGRVDVKTLFITPVARQGMLCMHERRQSLAEWL